MAVTLAIVGGSLVAGAPAVSAAPVADAVSEVTDAHTTRNLADIPTPWVVYGRYASLSTCRSIGSNGELHGRWLRWTCFDNRPIDVQLWVQYS
ncbi:hypothetical protein B4N89_36340 [Embleya scabrispora]|uniref:Ricin B lectin domain-containing protein n=1 Tax=Embleya scabrispora TaxID=159449 RepID=A0A1T3NLJ2_9ACTN|nr:hypothetical protein B4N89_36340 [Embleya scabrispora]